jgi:hypothetical protein
MGCAALRQRALPPMRVATWAIRRIRSGLSHCFDSCGWRCVHFPSGGVRGLASRFPRKDHKISFNTTDAASPQLPSKLPPQPVSAHVVARLGAVSDNINYRVAGWRATGRPASLFAGRGISRQSRWNRPPQDIHPCVAENALGINQSLPCAMRSVKSNDVAGAAAANQERP